MKSRSIPAIFLTLALVLTCLVFPLSVFADNPTPWDGTTATQPAGAGTEADPYLIANGENLKWFSNQVATANSSAYVKLTADIDLDGKPWTPIGNATYTFRGSFDGQGHTIFNMVVSGIDNCGLFGRLVNATATNVKFVGANITTNATTSGFGGVLAGYAQGSTISKINVDATSNVVGYNVGGIVGRTWSTMNTISNCINAATVKTDGQVGGEAAGGIVGLGAVATISYCINDGEIGFTTANGEVLVGGIAGRFGGTTAATLSYCLNTGSVSSSHTAGGIAGKNMQADCEFNNSVSTVAVTAGNVDYSGSLVGRFNATATANDCYVVTSEAYGVTGANAGEAAKGTLQNVIVVTTDDQIAAMNAAAKAIRDTAEAALGVKHNPTVPEAPELPAKEPATAFAATDIATAFESGTGEWNDPYIIKTAGQWMYFATRVNDGITYEGKYFALDDNIDFGNRILTPAGVGDKPFKGVFNGKGKTLSNFEISLTDDAATVYGALFGRTESAGIKNVIVSDARIHVQGKSSYAAGVVAFAAGSTVSACKVEDDVIVVYEGVATSENCTAGGVVGTATGNATVVNCSNEATVVATKPAGLVFAGGVVGSMAAATVSECRNSGYILAGTAGGWFDAGGIVGRMGISNKKGTVENCMNTGIVVSSQQAGGIVGTINATACILNNNLTNSVVFGNRDWAGLVLGRWGGLIVNATGNKYVQTTDPDDMGENAVTLISAGLGARTEANPTSGSTGLIQGETPVEAVAADAFIALSGEWNTKFDTDYTALVAKAEEEPQAQEEPQEEQTTTAEKEPATTAAPSSSEPEETTEPVKKAKKGCKSTVGGAMLVLAVLPMAATIIRKKKED